MNHDQKEADINVCFVLIPNNGLNTKYFCRPNDFPKLGMRRLISRYDFVLNYFHFLWALSKHLILKCFSYK